MAQSNPLVPWTDEQWARVNQVIQEEAHRARVAATFLPLYGPLPASADFVRTETVSYGPLRIADKNTSQLKTLQLNVRVRGEQLADPEMTSVLALFRRAANVIARLEDALVFNGYAGYDPDAGGATPPLPYGAPNVSEQIWGGGTADGLLIRANDQNVRPELTPLQSYSVSGGNGLVKGIVDAIGYLEDHGHFGPFAVVLSQELFLTAQTPVNIIGRSGTPSAVPEERILPFLGGGPLLRSSTLRPGFGVVVALGGSPIELVVATDVSLEFLQVTATQPPAMEGPYFIFRVYEKVSLRIKERDASGRSTALVALVPGPIVNRVAPNRGAVGGGTEVTITGNHFTNARAGRARVPTPTVNFGQHAGANVNVVSDREIKVHAPAGQGQVHVTVTTPYGASENSDADQFTYE